ncbi:MAG TPA: hypothetical protein ENN57_01500 [Chloroflexi bacterium]|nr:hypothetical protein [Chloroflexota bacterium]
MIQHIKLAGLIAALLVTFLPSFTLAQDLSFIVSTAEVRIGDLPPGKIAEFELTIHNTDEIAHDFTFTTLHPPEEERREGMAELPSDRWISFSPRQINLLPGSQDKVTVRVAIPREQRWTNKDWEVWLGITAESSDLLAVRLYVRLLLSTGATVETKSNAGLVAGIVSGIILLGCGGYYYSRRKARPE